jgi:hypothetical protein
MCRSFVGFAHVLACVLKGDQDTEERDAVRIHRRELLDADGSTPLFMERSAE